MPKHLQDSLHIQKSARMLQASGKTATQVTGDYLRQVWQHTLRTIEKSKGSTILRGTPIHVVLTVPAIWKDYVRDCMREAAKLAGILDKRPLAADTTLAFISEPEAAVMATMPELENGGDLAFGDSFVVCDCGGGTVDIISYRTEVAQPLTIRECVEGQGECDNSLKLV
jgi:molecular chaperone DnaK (HSP70)